MEDIKKVLTSLNTTSTIKNRISNNRCSDCNRPLVIEGDKERCYYCEVVSKENQEIATNAIKQRDRMRIQKLFEESSLINDKLKACTFNNYAPKTEKLQLAKKTCERYANNFSLDNKVGLLITGPYGTGKSHLSVSITKTVLDNGFTAVFISVPKLMTKIQNTYNKQSDTTEEDLMNAIMKVDLLVLDDLGAEKTKKDDSEFSWARRKMFELIDGRSGKHNVATSNYEISELFKMYGEREVSRLLENMDPVEMPGENHRMRRFKG